MVLSRQYISINLVASYFCSFGPIHAIALLSLPSLFDANKQSALRIKLALLVSANCLKNLYNNSACGSLFLGSCEFQRCGWNVTLEFGEKLFKKSKLQSIGLRKTLSQNWFIFSLQSVIDGVELLKSWKFFIMLSFFCNLTKVLFEARRHKCVWNSFFYYRVMNRWFLFIYYIWKERLLFDSS